MKKLLNVLLILAVLFTNLVPTTVLAAAGRNTEKNGTITINNAVENETYTIYKMLNILSYDEEKGVASYEVVKAWEDFFTKGTYAENFDLTASATKTLLIDSSDLDSVDMAQFAKDALVYAENLSNDGQLIAKSTTVVFKDLELGYYLVDSSVGTLCHIDNTMPNATINEKNEKTPDDTKSIIEDNQELTNSSTAKIGDTVDYVIELNNIENLSNVKAKDTMSDGLTLNEDSIYVTADGKEVTPTATTYTLTTTTNGFEINFYDSYLEGNTAAFVITYSAVLNENAVINGDNTNDFKVTYGNNQEIETASVTTKSYEVTFTKTDETGTVLEGAKFVLYQKANMAGSIDRTTISVVVLEDGIYRVATAEELEDATTTVVSNSNGLVTVKGLENGTYEFEEIEAPEGYNKLAKPVEFKIKDASIEEGFTIINTSGMILPSTGGMGTVLFITVGSIMALGFGVNLVTKARMRKIED